MAQTNDKVTLNTLREMRSRKEPIACLTAYDATFAHLFDTTGVDLILVGDSLGMVIQGRENTTGVRVADMAYHSRCVTAATRRAFVMADMPFMSAATTQDAIRGAARIMGEGGVSGVKIEFGEAQVDVVKVLSANGIPVCAHMGLRPQWIHAIGGFKRQHAGIREYRKLVKMAVDAGADMLLLECVASNVAERICREVAVPVIGIGSGSKCDGQIMVSYDIFGLGRTPYFARNFLSGKSGMAEAVKAYVTAVKQRDFP